MIGRALAGALFLTLISVVPALCAEAASACSVSLSYGSVAAGIDKALAQKLERQVRHDHRIVKTERRSKGLEGEYELCLTVEPPSKARTVFRSIRALMPATSEKTPTTLTLLGGGRYQTKWKAK